MSELTSVLDELAALDLETLSAPEKLDLVAELSAGVNRLQAVLCRAVRAADADQAHAHDGAVSMKAWLRGACHLSPVTRGGHGARQHRPAAGPGGGCRRRLR
jgi:hypothetical protein